MNKQQEFNAKIYYLSRSSVIRAISDCCRAVKELEISKDATFFDFDSHAENFELIQNDVIGLRSYATYDEDGVVRNSFYVVCSTMNDKNGIRLSKIVSYVFARFLSGNTINVFNEESEIITSLNITSGTEVMPMSKADNRMAQYVDVSCLLSAKTR